MADAGVAAVASMRHYYAQRAAIYESIFHKPERQADLRAIEAWLPAWFAGRHVLEIASGTGWWIAHAARDCASWLATDINDEVIAIARTKPLPPGKVHFARADAYALALGEARFDAAFAGFWWSHVPLQALPGWLDTLHARLEPGATVVLLDNRYVPGSSTPVARRDAQGNSYQLRRLPDGSTHEVLKNFPDETELRRLVGARGRNLQWQQWPHHWAAVYQRA